MVRRPRLAEVLFVLLKSGEEKRWQPLRHTAI
jgi:hypothetical protein